MKIKALIILVLSAVSFIGNAQIDRSKQPTPGPIPAINLDKPENFTLKNGLKVLIVEDHKLPRVAIRLSLDNPPFFEGTKAGTSSLLGALFGSGTTTIAKDAFNEEIDYLGASMDFSSNSATANTLSKYFPRVLELLSTAALDPKFTEDEFQKEKDILLEGLKSQEKDVKSIANRAATALAYGKDHAYGEFLTPESVQNVSLADVQEHYNSYFVPKNAYLVIVGDVQAKEVKKLVKKHFSAWDTKDITPSKLPEVKNLEKTTVNFIDMPNAVQSEIIVENVATLTKNDPDYFPVLIANEILGGGGEARLFLNLREDKGYTYGAYSRITDNKYVPTRFRASASVRNAVTDSAVVAFLEELRRIRTEEVTDEELKNTKYKYTGEFVLALEKPANLAKYALNIEKDQLPEDFYQTYLEKINAVTAADIQRVANKYFLLDNARIIVVGKGAEVLPNLKKLSFDGKPIGITYYNKTMDPVVEPVFKKPIPEGVTAETVLDNYIKAVGGKEALEKVTSIAMIAKAEMQGMQLDLNTKITKAGQMAILVSMGGNVMSKQVFDGSEGYVAAQGQKIPITEEQKADMKEEATTFIELQSDKATLEGIETINDADCYVLSFGSTSKHYYDVKTGLKVLFENKVKQGEQEIITKRYLTDYKSVDGIQFPHTLSQSFGPQKFDFIVSEIKINEPINVEDFK